jgi:hypothetical protein
MNLGPNPVNTTFRYLLNQSGTNITLGDNTAVNWNGANVVARTGAQTISGVKTFANNIAAVSFGFGATNNSFGDTAMQNYFGNSAVSNDFGSNASTLNQFGAFSEENSFGSNSQNNGFGDGATDNYFGNSAVNNYFGDGVNNNTFGGGLFNSGIRLLLPQFNGLSSQAGQFGELRVSGSGLYVCTGTTGGWRRTFLLSF